MGEFEQKLSQLLLDCPEVTLTASDIQDIIDNGLNGVIRRYRGVKEEVAPAVEAVVEEIEEFDEEIDTNAEIQTHIEECTDEFCECKSVFDEIEEE